jgi:hypothetical protein
MYPTGADIEGRHRMAITCIAMPAVRTAFALIASTCILSTTISLQPPSSFECIAHIALMGRYVGMLVIDMPASVRD